MGEAKRKRQASMAHGVRLPAPKEITLPERVLEFVAQRFPDAWRYVDLVRKKPEIVGLERGWAPWCYLPVNVAAGVAAKVLENEYSETEVEQLLTQPTRLLAALAAWRMTKGVYVFDEEVLRALVDSDVQDDVPDEMFLRLPEWCPYISTPGLEIIEGVFIHGFFAYVDDHGAGGTAHPPELNLEILLDPAKSDESAIFPLAMANVDVVSELMSDSSTYTSMERTSEVIRGREFIHMHTNVDLGQGSFLKASQNELSKIEGFVNSLPVIQPGQTLEHPEQMAMGLSQMLRRNIADHPEAKTEEARLIRKMTQIKLRLAHLLLYLCADERDISPEGLGHARDIIRANERRGIRNFQAREIKTWEVGFRIGAEIRRHQQPSEATSGEATGTGLSKRPHLRRAHWHAFWKGPRSDPAKRTLHVRWLPPIPVNVSSSADLVPTVRPVS